MIYVKHKFGHREFGANTIAFVTGDNDIVYNMSMRALQCSTLRFSTIEDNSYLFFILALIRNIFGKKTSGLLLNPWAVFKKRSIKALFKKSVLMFFKRCKHITVICYVPYYLDDRYELISEDWIYDLEFWDLMLLEREKLLPVQSEKVKDKTSIYFLGAIAARKGINLLSFLKKNLTPQVGDIEFVIKGKIQGDTHAIRESLVWLNDCIEDKYLSDSEFIYYASKSTHLWCCYDPSYNSSSGILGRALQLNKVPIIRKGSSIDLICQYENLDCMRLVYEEHPSISKSFLRSLEEKPIAASANLKFVQKALSRSVKVIKKRF
ncbi:hypothetical protein N9E53_01285 [Amylibacter sp.]|nr:hypothetical protein [Amylibacter sp.]